MPEQLARTFDPRSWGNCFEHFRTHRVDERDGHFPPHDPDKGPIGQPWSPATTPHLFFERVELEDEHGTNSFENILRVPSFEVSPTFTRLEFILRISKGLTIPSLGLDMPKCVNIDEGYLQATLLTPVGSTAPLSQVEIVKKVQFVDIDLESADVPAGLDPGEILNYLAPASLCMWLEDLTQDGVCCTP
jgi:hypothetical protein